MMFRLQPFVIAVVQVTFLCGASASGQVPEGKISGIVRDATGAVVPGVTIIVTNQATNASQTTTTGTGWQLFAVRPTGRL